MTRQDAPTLEDVARAAQVSTATISRSINTPDKVAKATHERIQQAIDTLGYTPHFGGRVLASNRTNTIGAVIPSMANAMFSNGLQAFQEELSDAGMTMLIANTGYSPEAEFTQIRSLMARGADGLLLIGSERPQKTTDFLALRRVPHVISWCYKDNPDQLYVGFDNTKAAFAMATCVLDHGHRNIAMIGGISKDNDRAKNRIAGVKKAIDNYGGGARFLGFVESRYTLAESATAFDEIYAGPRLPSAIICGNDVLAAGAITRARERGIKVPEQVSITGFDDIGLASVVTPALTTVRVPQIEMGKTAARRLLAKLSGDPDVESFEYQTEVIIRASLGRNKPGTDPCAPHTKLYRSHDRK